ncbi:hypothetical protein D5086_003010 [Populus alba]|uniref:Uncharacterized protein n=1 Tax=Populus alba TaxID=43335 RepID=A0ACC4D3E1_POPAL
MALSTLQQLLKKSPPHSRILASLQNTHLLQSPNANPPVNSHHLETKPTENNSTIDGRPFLFGSSKVENLTHLNPWFFSPISPVQIFSYQNLSSGSAQDGSNDDDSGMWADSWITCPWELNESVETIYLHSQAFSFLCCPYGGNGDDIAFTEYHAPSVISNTAVCLDIVKGCRVAVSSVNHFYKMMKAFRSIDWGTCNMNYGSLFVVFKKSVLMGLGVWKRENVKHETQRLIEKIELVQEDAMLKV